MIQGEPYPVPLVGHHNYVYSIAFSPKGNMLVSGSYDEAVFLWDVRGARVMRSLPAHSDPVGGVDFIHDGTMVASCSSDGLTYVSKLLSFSLPFQTLNTLPPQPRLGHIDRPMSPHSRPRRQRSRDFSPLFTKRQIHSRLDTRFIRQIMELRRRAMSEDISGPQKRKI